jgi:H+-translocating NAD(P) transhydrogenase subunit alpha
LTEPGKVVVKESVTLVGLLNYPAMIPADASNFYGNNLISFLGLITENQSGKLSLNFNLEDDIVAASMVTHQGEVRLKKR